MQSIAKYCLLAVLCLPIAAAAQTDGGKKCTTFDRYLTASQPGVNGKVTTAMSRPVMQLSMLSPGKKFRIHYDTSGINLPEMVTQAGVPLPGTAKQFVDSVAKIFDSVWVAEVTTYGFAPPPADNGEGGGDEFDIYIQDLGANSFGYTSWDETSPVAGTSAAPRYPAYIVVDNDYGQGFRTMGIAGLKSTAAHEFHHAIQVGGYGLWNDDIYFYELTAEAMEPTVFSTSKDYIFDMSLYFNSIENFSIYSPYSSAQRGYERAIWSIFLIKRYGVGIMRQMWEAIGTVKPIVAMKTVLEKNGTSMAVEFSEFCYWNYFTGARADSARYYTDAKLYPAVSIRQRQELGSTAAIFQYTCKGFGVNYLQGIHQSDTAAFIIANLNMDDALGTQTNSYGYQLRASTGSVDGGTPLANGWSANFSVTDPANWKYITVSSASVSQTSAVICYPNPFRPSASKLFFGPLGITAGGNAAQLTVFTANYDRVYSGPIDVAPSFGSNYAAWNGLTAGGQLVASGIYIYTLTAGDRVVKGKFAVVR